MPLSSWSSRPCHYHHGRRHLLSRSIGDAEDAAMIVIITADSDAKDDTMIVIIKSWETGNH